MKKALFILCALSLFYAAGCAEKTEKKEAPKPQAAAPAETETHVSGGSPDSEAHVSGAPAAPQPAAPQPATEETEHVSGN